MMDLKRIRDETSPGTIRQEIATAAAPSVAACCLVYCTARERQSPLCKLVEDPVQASPSWRVVLLQQEAGSTVLAGEGGGEMLRALLYLHICQGMSTLFVMNPQHCSSL